MSSRQNSNLNYIMGSQDPSIGFLNNQERPNHKLEVKLQLTKLNESVLKSLKPDLRKDGMEVRKDRNHADAIVVIGTPPEYGYEAKDVLKKVREHDVGAKILSQRKISC